MSFPDNQVYCIVDYETYSEADLKSVGAWEYSMHPSTQILCVAWRIGTRESILANTTKSYSPLLPGSSFGSLQFALLNTDVILVAHNALFEQVITRNVFSKLLHKDYREKLDVPPSRWLCTASLASALALPRKLEGAANVLKLKVQKDMEGHRLMMKMSKPRKPTKNNATTRHVELEDLERLVQYCVTDIDAEVGVFLSCPPLTKMEREVWQLDQVVNLRGVQIDTKLVKTILEMIAVETEKLNRETEEITFGELTSTNKIAKVGKWLEANGVFLENLRKGTVEAAIEDGLVNGDTKRILEIRQATGKTSTAKYEAYESRSRFDGRVRDTLLYHAASTGRWGGQGVQLQNLPRPKLKQKDIEYIIGVLNGE